MKNVILKNSPEPTIFLMQRKFLKNVLLFKSLTVLLLFNLIVFV